MNLDEQTVTTWMRSLRGHEGLVVLDDIGRERISEWTGELLYTVVNDRYEFRLPTIATSNLSAQELVAAGYWPAISRLAQDGALVEIKAPDFRLRGTKP
jgi:DNA replication protein DnaC